MNLSISLVIRQWMQVLVVSAVVGLFFVAFGMVGISGPIRLTCWICGCDPAA